MSSVRRLSAVAERSSAGLLGLERLETPEQRHERQPEHVADERRVELEPAAGGGVQDLAFVGRESGDLRRDEVRHGRRTREVADRSRTRAEDLDTADLFTDISRGLDKLLWLIEAHLQAKE